MGRKGPTRAIKLEEHEVAAAIGAVSSSRTVNVVYNAYLCGLLGCTDHVSLSAPNEVKIEHLRSVLQSSSVLLEDAGSGPGERSGAYVEYDAKEAIMLRMHRSDVTKDRWGLVRAQRSTVTPV
jgi:hypothetical protein